MMPCGKARCRRLGLPSCDFCQDKLPQYRGRRGWRVATGKLEARSRGLDRANGKNGAI